jgi:hypothetical protein
VGHVIKFAKLWTGPERLIRELETRIKSDFYQQIVVGTGGFRYEWINESIDFESVVKWVEWEEMSDEEKQQNNCFCCGGYYKKIDYKQAWMNLWNTLTENQKKEVKDLPNYDSDIFFEITGIQYK